MICSLIQQWQEPEDGHALWFLDLDNDEAEKFKEALAWLEKHGGEEIGSSLSEFQFGTQPNLSGKADAVGLDAAMRLLATESRYEEDRTFYHETERHPLLEAACTSEGHWL